MQVVSDGQLIALRVVVVLAACALQCAPPSDVATIVPA
jgi:hypothetical protein